MDSKRLAAILTPPSKVLLVEDEARIAQFVAKGLRRTGLDVTVAEDGDVGAFLAATEPFDLVLLDLGLPGTPGLEILRLIRRDRPATPVILLTAADEPLARRAGLAAGATEYLTKPFVFEDLLALVRRLVGLEDSAPNVAGRGGTA
jgi:two-component system, OmpR family, copper resistance phosphate regulon response regulator CusR